MGKAHCISFPGFLQNKTPWLQLGDMKHVHQLLAAAFGQDFFHPVLFPHPSFSLSLSDWSGLGSFSMASNSKQISRDSGWGMQKMLLWKAPYLRNENKVCLCLRMGSWLWVVLVSCFISQCACRWLESCLRLSAPSQTWSNYCPNIVKQFCTNLTFQTVGSLLLEASTDLPACLSCTLCLCVCAV